MLRPIALAFGIALFVLPAPAPLRAETALQVEAPSPAAVVTEALRIGDLIEVLREEGLDYAGTLDQEMLGGSGGERWLATVGEIYDAGRLQRLFDQGLAAELTPADEPHADAIRGFFTGDLGGRILDLEIEARRSLLDEAVEDAARVAWADLEAAKDPRAELITRFAEANDLIESNVSGALNSNLAFYRGLVEEGALGDGMTEEDMLADVWGQEPELRAETSEWLFPYLSLAYSALSDSEIEDYIAFSETPAGRRMNAALFATFGRMFDTLSYDLGRALARNMRGQDI
jgi:hypothetical protein